VIKLPNRLSYFFTQIFKEIDDEANKDRFNIAQYNMRVSSLEEVFNALGEREHQLEIEKGEASIDDQNLPLVDYPTRELSSSEILKLLLKRRRLISKRNKEILGRVVIPMILGVSVMLSVTKELIRPWDSMTVSEVNTIFNDNTGGWFHMAYAEDFQTTPQVKISDFVNNNEAFN